VLLPLIFAGAAHADDPAVLVPQSPAVSAALELPTDLPIYPGLYIFGETLYEFTDWFNMCNGLAAPAVGANQTSRRQGNLLLEAVAIKVGFVF